MELDHVSKHYDNGSGPLIALADISFQLPAGQFLSIMGPSGSGNEYALNLMAGLDSPSGRSASSSMARDLVELSDDARGDLRLRHIGFVFQSFNLFPSFTVEEERRLAVEVLAGPMAMAARREQPAAALQVGIETAARDRRPSELSGGEQQRVGDRTRSSPNRASLRGRADGNLDSRTGQTVLDLLQTLNVEQALTIVLVTHSTFAATYGQRTIEMRTVRSNDVSAPRESSARSLPLGVPDLQRPPPSPREPSPARAVPSRTAIPGPSANHKAQHAGRWRRELLEMTEHENTFADERLPKCSHVSQDGCRARSGEARGRAHRFQNLRPTGMHDPKPDVILGEPMVS